MIGEATIRSERGDRRPRALRNPADRQGDADERERQREPRPTALEPPPDPQGDDCDDRRIDVDDQRRQRDRHLLEARVIGPGVGRVEDPEGYSDERGPAIEQPQPASAVRPGEHPQPGQQSTETEAPGGQDMPPDALLDRRAGRRARRSRRRRRRSRTRTIPMRVAALHRRRLVREGTDYTCLVSELTERAVTARAPSVADERLKVLSRREPVTVPPGTSLADCVAAIRRTGTGDSVFVDQSRRHARRRPDRARHFRPDRRRRRGSQPARRVDDDDEAAPSPPRGDGSRRDRADADRSLSERPAPRRRGPPDGRRSAAGHPEISSPKRSRRSS